jgi:hypothetical protein
MGADPKCLGERPLRTAGGGLGRHRRKETSSAETPGQDKILLAYDFRKDCVGMEKIFPRDRENIPFLSPELSPF